MDERIRLLVVDDDEAFLESLTKRLERRRFQVTAATGAGPALAVLRGGAFDVILMDLKMPGMSGRDLMAEIRNTDPEIELVVLTGHGSYMAAQESSKLGVFDFLSKPCDIDKLTETLRLAAWRRQVRRGADDLMMDRDPTLHLF